jgi:hypothetical protein
MAADCTRRARVLACPRAHLGRMSFGAVHRDRPRIRFLKPVVDEVAQAAPPVRTKAKLRAAATAHMDFIAANPDRVRSYFQDPIVQYAA